MPNGVKFHLGQRVICTETHSVFGSMTGFYGFVRYVAAIKGYDDHVVGVQLTGFIAGVREREERDFPDSDFDDWFARAQRKPWPFFGHELEAAD